MQTKQISSLNNTSNVLTAILSKINGISKPMNKFLWHIVLLWPCVRGRYNFTNIARYSNEYCEQSLRNIYSKNFSFLEFNIELIRNTKGQEYVLAFDPSYISKSGKKTYGLGYYWSGVAQQTKKGLELSCLAAIDISSNTAMHLDSFQTPSKNDRDNKSVIDLYVEFILKSDKKLTSISKYLVADGFFMKKEFILPLVKNGFEVITKMRSDANLCYQVKAKDQPKGRGRKKIKGDKIKLHKIDKRRWRFEGEANGYDIYSIIAYCVILKRETQIVYLYHPKRKSYEILLSTDINLDALKIVNYYGARFQIEFLIRDAKQHSGLEDCQARSKEKLEFHFNLSLTMVSIIKASYYLNIPIENRGAFSIDNIKRINQNKYLTDFIFDNLDISMSCNKIKKLYNDCLQIGSLAA